MVSVCEYLRSSYILLEFHLVSPEPAIRKAQATQDFPKTGELEAMTMQQVGSPSVQQQQQLQAMNSTQQRLIVIAVKVTEGSTAVSCPPTAGTTDACSMAGVRASSLWSDPDDLGGGDATGVTDVLTLIAASAAAEDDSKATVATLGGAGIDVASAPRWTLQRIGAEGRVRLWTRKP